MQKLSAITWFGCTIGAGKTLMWPNRAGRHIRLTAVVVDEPTHHENVAAHAQ